MNTKEIIIYTRGKSYTKSKPFDSQKTYNATCLSCSNIKLKNKTGKQKDVQKSILECSKFSRWIENVIQDVEQNNYTIIDIFCNRGKHRSVASAELIKKLYYPNAIIIHIDLNS